MDHRSYRSWFTREAVQLLGVQAQIDYYLSQPTGKPDLRKLS